MKVGIGYSNRENALTSGEIIAAQAISSGDIEHAAFALAFCNSNVNARDLLTGIRRVIGPDAPVLGGSAIGIITNDVISYEDHPAGIIIVEDDDIQVQYAHADELNLDETQAGRALSEQLAFREHDVTLLFYDSVREPPSGDAPPLMNSSTPLLKGIEERCGWTVPILGGGTVGDYAFSPTIQFTGKSVHTQSATALRLRGNLNVDWRIAHGCSLKDGIYHTITKIEGPVLYELDGRPVVEIMNKMYGSEDWQKQVPVKRLAIGINHGDRFAPSFQEADYVNRLIIGVLPDKTGVVLFEADLEVGIEIQFMLRDSKMMIQSARENAQLLVDEVEKSGRTPKWAFYIDCGGRTSWFSESLTEEATEVQDILNKHGIPLFGFYSGVEIAPLSGKSRGLDWTGLLAIFSE